jgi:long-chain acyl-CoA synthetase
VGAAFPGSTLHEFYGTSELSYIALGRVDPQQPASRVGRPLPGVAVAILDAERRPLATGAIGEIFVRSPFMFMGYAAPGGQPSLAGCTLHGDYLSVGDTGFVDHEGALHLVGRADRMLLVAGRNIHPEAVETVLLGAPGVRRVAVLGEPDERRGQRLVAILESVERMDPAALRAYCRQHLPAHSIPQRFYHIADWPLTASHKTDYPALRARLLAGELSGP